MPWSNQGGGPWQPKNQGPWGNGPQGGGNGGGKGPPDLEEMLRRGQQRLRQVLPGGGRGNGFGALGVATLVVVAALFWLLTGFYTVRPNEVGMNLVFGKYRGKTSPGLNYNWPSPLGSVVKVPVTDVNTMQIGRSQGARDDSLMLTGDERIVDIDFTVFWQVRADAPEKFAFNLKNPQSTIRAVAESAMREVVGRSQLNQIVASAVSQGANSRVQVETDVRTLMQRLLDEYNSGVLITSINVRPIDVPQQVIDAFRDINNADQEATQVITQAQTYESRIIPESNADAAKILRESEGYREATVAQARGQAGRFDKIYQEYRKAPDVTRERLFLETMERVYAGMDKVIVNQPTGSQGVVPFLPLGELQQPRRPAAAPARQP